MTLDISSAIQAKSDQLNAADLTGGPVVVRIERVRESTGQADKEKQPFEVIVSGLKPWRPCKTSFRVLSALWGVDASKWVGHTIRLWRDPTVDSPTGDKGVGGIRIDGADIKATVTLTLPEKRGRYKQHRIEAIEPLTAPKGLTLEELLTSAGLTLDALDAHRAKTGKPPVSTLTDNQRGQLAAHYLANPGQLDEVVR